MPGKDGFEVAAFVRSRPELAGVAVVLLTGAFDAARRGARRAGWRGRRAGQAVRAADGDCQGAGSAERPAGAGNRGGRGCLAGCAACRHELGAVSRRLLRSPRQGVCHAQHLARTPRADKRRRPTYLTHPRRPTHLEPQTHPKRVQPPKHVTPSRPRPRAWPIPSRPCSPSSRASCPPRPCCLRRARAMTSWWTASRAGWSSSWATAPYAIWRPTSSRAPPNGWCARRSSGSRREGWRPRRLQACGQSAVP